MKYTLHITQKVESDIIKVADYIEYNLLNPQAADDLLDMTEEVLGNLTDMPQIHQLVEDPVLKAWGIRFVLINDYLAFYIIYEDTNSVFIVRFLHGKRNWIAILKNETITLG